MRVLEYFRRCSTTVARASSPGISPQSKSGLEARTTAALALFAAVSLSAAGELWIPQNEIPNALKSAPRAVLLTREQYEALQREANPPATETAEAAPAPVILRSLTMTAQPAGGIVAAQVEMSLEVLSPTPAALPLNFEPAVLAALELDETTTLAASADAQPLLPEPQQNANAQSAVDQKKTAAPPRRETSALLPPGRHTLKATLHLPVAVSAAGRTIAVRGTLAGASSFSLTLPAADRIESALAWSSKPGAEGQTIHTFTLPPGAQPHAITWSTRDIRDLPGTALVQVCDYDYRVDAVRLHATLHVQLLSRLTALPGSLTMPVPETARILSVEGTDVLSWTPAADKTGLNIALTPQADRHTTDITVALDAALPAAENGKPRALTLPFPQLAGVHRASGRFVLHTEGDIRVLKVTPPPLAAQNTPTAEELAAMSGDFAGLWDFAVITAAPALEIEDLAPVFHATQDTQIALQRDGVHLTRHLTLVPRQGKLFSVRLTLPAGEEMLTLTQKDGALPDWQKLSSDAAGTVLEVRFPAGLKPGDQPVLLLTSRLDPANWNALPPAGTDLRFTRAGVAGADKLSGFIAVSLEDRFAVSTAAAAGLEPRDPASLGDDVPVRGGFVWFAPGEFTLPLHVSARAAEFDAQFSAFALPMLHGVEIEGALDLDIRESGLRELSVQLPPAAAPHLHFDSPLVSGTKLNAETGAWALTLREELRGRQSLRWRLLLPVKMAESARGFAAELPVLQVPGARRTATHWAMEANTDTELTFTTAGLEERDTLTLPAVAGYAPRHRVIAAWSARGSEWKLALSARRHLPAPLPALVVDRYALTTSVSTDGTLRHLAALTVRSNGQQFLDLPLPADARILTLLVDGAPQKPAASGTAALRVQLPSGTLKPITLALTWQVPGESWDASGERKVEPMRLGEDIPVLASTWTLRLPEGFAYSGFQSDMQRVDGPAQPELDLVPDFYKSEERSAGSTAAPNFLPGGGGGGGGGELAGYKMERPAAPESNITIKPQMPKPLFAGTPLPDSNPPPNLDRSTRNTLSTEAPAGTRLVSRGAAVTSSDPSPIGDLSLVTDGDKQGDDGYFVDLQPGRQWVQIDLGKSFEIHLLWLWHFHKQAVIYNDVVVQIADNPSFNNALTVFNNDADNSSGFGPGADLAWVETNQGRSIPVSGVTGRYVRLWSKGRNIDDTNQYIEVEVYGREPGAQRESDSTGAVRLKIMQSSAPDIFNTSSRDAMMSIGGNWLETQIKLINSPALLKKAATQIRLGDAWGVSDAEAASRLASMVKVEQENGSEVISVKVDLPDANESSRIARAVVTAYEETRREFEADLVRRRVKALEVNKAKMEEDVEAARLKMLEVTKKYGIVDSANSATEAGLHYFAAKQEWESAQLQLNSLKDIAARTAVDDTVMKKPVQLLDGSGPEPNSETETAPEQSGHGTGLAGMTSNFTTADSPRSIAGLLPLEFALPDEGQAFHFGGHHVPGAITFTARSLQGESRVAWLWIAAGLAAAGVLARRRPWFYGLLGALLLWLVPWILNAGMGPGHQALIGWCAGCGCVLVFRFFARRQAAVVSAPAVAAAMVALWLLPQAPARAEAAPAAPSIMVPYDPALPMAEQHPQQVYVDYDAFQKLWKQARDARLARNAPPPPLFEGRNAAVLSALYEAGIAGGALKVEAVLTIHTTGAWAALSLRHDDKSAPFAGASIAALTLDEKAAVLQNGALLVEKPGRHVLKASLHAPLPGDWRTLALQLPPAPAALLSLNHRDASLRLKLNGGLPLEVREQRDGGYAWRGTAALGAAGELRIERLPAVTLAAGAEKPTLGAVRARLFVTPAIERLDSRIDFAFAGAERRDFSFAFDGALTPVQIDIANLESWSMRDAGAQRVLDFHLSVPARDGFTAGFIAERAAASKPGEEHQAPAVITSASRQEYTLEILSSDEFDLVPQAAGGWARSELKGMGTAAETGFRSAGAWKLAGAWTPLPWLSLAQPLKRSAQADYAWKLAGGMLETTVTFTLRAGEHEDLSALSIPLPAGAALQSLDGERLKDWWRAGDTVELRFAGATGETTTVWLDFTQPVTDGHRKNGLPLPCLKLPGYDEVKGRAVLATGPETDVRLRLDDKAVFAREVEAEQARGDYIFLPPLVLRRGFTYEEPEFHVTALLEPVEPAFAARWVLGAAVQETWTETQVRVDVEVRQGALPEVRFTMPGNMPGARVSGEQVRETVPAVLPDGRREYRVIFQSPVTSAAQLTIALELPHTGSIALPDIEFPGAALTERFLIMQNFSSGEIVPDMAASTGVEALARDAMQDLHFTVQGFTNPLSWRLKPGWKLAAAHRTLQATSGPQAVVLYAELTTMLRAEGPEWLRAVYHLQNRALQFLPLRLPEGMELVSATVAGSPVRADSATLADGKSGLLIPLIQTRPGDLAMDVEIVCRVKSAAGSTARTLDDPDIPGVSIQRTLWNVWTPPGYDLSDAGGNMERVEEQKSFMEKLETDFDELNVLSSLSSAAKDGRVRRNAQTMAAVKIVELEQKLESQEKQASGKRIYGKSAGGEDYSEARTKLETLKKQVAEKGAADMDDQSGVQQFDAQAKWAWASNSSYLDKRGKDSAHQQSKQQELVLGNWSVNGGVLSSNPTINSKVQPAQKPAGAEGKPQTEPTVRRRNAQISSLNESVPQAVQTKPGKQGDDKSSFQLDGVKSDRKEAAQQLFNNVRGLKSSQGDATKAPGTKPADGGEVFGFASPAPARETGVLPPPVTAAPDVASAQMVPAPGSPMVTRADAAQALAAASGEPAPPPAPPPAPVLKPAGRVSIPVSFPLDGTVHRFRKINDRAALTLALKPPVQGSVSSRWLAAGLLAAGLGLLWLVNRKTRRRV